MPPRPLLAVSVGLLAGLTSGLFGVGGGIVIVPLLVWLYSFDQHRAHATSLAAIVPIALGGVASFAFGGSLRMDAALALAAGSLAGAPVGAALMARAPEASLKVAFGAVTVVVGVLLVVT